MTQNQSQPVTTDTGASAMGELSTMLAGLRTRFNPSSACSEFQSTFQSLSERLADLEAEHSGMADELLTVYEQLGIVFEVAHQLPELRSETRILDMFQTSLSRTFRHCRTKMYRPDSQGVLVDPDGSMNPWLQELMQRACADQRTRVKRPSQDARCGADVVEVMVSPVFSGDEFVGANVLLRPSDTPEFRASDMMLIESLSLFCGDMIRNHRLLAEMRGMAISMVRSLVSAVDQKDAYTSGHSVRVGYFATMLARGIDLPREELQLLQWSALLHDVGKIGIRDDVLKKEGRLTDEEFDHMKEHPVRSWQVVKGVPQLAGALDGVRHHHEKFDGTGYPDGLVGEGIPLQARIILVADIFDALTSNRSYRSAFSWEKALKILEEEEGRVNDPRLRRTFDRLMRASIDEKDGGWEALIAEAEAFALDEQEVD